MKNLKGVIAICFLSLVTLSGCHMQFQSRVTQETFVNKADERQVLTLYSQPSSKLAFLGRFMRVEMTGRYTLKNDSGTISGGYTYVIDRKKDTREYSFRPEHGEHWNAQQDSKGLFRDQHGMEWRTQQVKVDSQAKVLQDSGK